MPGRRVPRHFGHLAHRLHDLLAGALLLLRGERNLADRLRRAIDHLDDLLQAAARARGERHAVLHFLDALLGRQHRRVGRRLNLADDALDFFGGFARALGQAAHFARDDREPLAVLARGRRLDRRVDGEQVDLAGDVLDQVEHFRDALRALAEQQRLAGDVRHAAADLLHRFERLADRVVSRMRRLRAVVGDLLHRRRAQRNLLRGVRQLFHRRGDLRDRRGLLHRSRRVLFGGASAPASTRR